MVTLPLDLDDLLAESAEATAAMPRGHRDRARAPEGRRRTPRGRLLPRRARPRRAGAAALRGLSLRRRLSPPHRRQLLAEPGRPAGSRQRAGAAPGRFRAERRRRRSARWSEGWPGLEARPVEALRLRASARAVSPCVTPTGTRSCSGIDRLVPDLSRLTALLGPRFLGGSFTAAAPARSSAPAGRRRACSSRPRRRLPRAPRRRPYAHRALGIRALAGGQVAHARCGGRALLLSQRAFHEPLERRELAHDHVDDRWDPIALALRRQRDHRSCPRPAPGARARAAAARRARGGGGARTPPGARSG